MIPTLYEPFRHWSEGGSIFILSDLHFDDEDCRLMDPDWISPEEQLAIINKTVANESVRFNIEDDKMLDAIRAFGRSKGSDEE